jgi:methenyltetrahydromethanopterin cyclohydrolase
MNLNHLAWRRCDRLMAMADRLRIALAQTSDGTRVFDFGVEAVGGLIAGRFLAEACLATLGDVSIVPGSMGDWTGPVVTVQTDHPRLACMASQYAGWQIARDKYFAMGSGPMRAVAGRESLFEELGCRETSDRVVGILESSKLPPAEVCGQIAEQCQVTPDHVILLVARTASLAGTVQVVARSVETALHKMHELGFDLASVVSGFGAAPLPPVAANDLAGIGRTNDAILYGGQVTLWIQADDDQLAELGPKIPSNSSTDFGEPFAEIFERSGRDFYKIDPLLFSPAEVTLVNLVSGRRHHFGTLRPDVLARSFAA